MKMIRIDVAADDVGQAGAEVIIELRAARTAFGVTAYDNTTVKEDAASTVRGVLRKILDQCAIR